jgi:predicted transglutaminase-like cysteine proteinase
MRRLPALIALVALSWLASWSLARPAWHPERIVRAAALRGTLAEQSARELRAAMDGALKGDERSRVGAVNDFYNHHLQYRDDIETWGEVDHWASPLESLEQGSGDCEDFAIAKFFTLVAMGLPPERLRLVYVRAAMGAAEGGAVQPHMVLAYYPAPQADPVVLDNLVPELRQASERSDLAPVFSFNADGLWEGVGQVAVGGAGPVERLGRWREVLAKAHDEGFFP